MDGLVRSGHWWLPGSPDERVSGEVTFSEQDGIRLRLIGSLSSTRDLLTSRVQLPLVHRFTTAGEHVTLADAINRGSQLTSPGIAVQTLSAQTLFLGPPLADPGTTTFRRVNLRCSHLLEWAGRFGLSLTIPANPDTKAKGPALEVAYKSPDKVEIPTTRGLVRLSYSFHQAGDLRSEVRLQQATWLCLDHPLGLSLLEWEQQLFRPLTTLLTLAAGRPSYVHEISLLLNAEPENAEPKFRGSFGLVQGRVRSDRELRSDARTAGLREPERAAVISRDIAGTDFEWDRNAALPKAQPAGPPGSPLCS